MKWFKHDTDANRDAKLEKVLMKYGSDGYALYWLCLELIAAPIDKHNINFELKHDAEILGHKLKIDSVRVEEIMRYFIGLKLFEHDSTTNRITCLKLANRIENSIVKNPQLIEIQRLISQEIPDNPGLSGTIRDNSGKSRLDTDTDTDLDLLNNPEAKLPLSPVDGKKKTLKTYLDLCQKAEVKAIPKDHAVFKYAQKMNLEHDMIAAAWYQFKHKYINQQKLYKDWRLTFLNCVKENWLKLWWFDPEGKVSWTSKGNQALKAMQIDADGDL